MPFAFSTGWLVGRERRDLVGMVAGCKFGGWNHHYLSQVGCDCIGCLEDLGSSGTKLLIYMMVIEDARWWNGADRAISIGERHTDCPTLPLSILALWGLDNKNDTCYNTIGESNNTPGATTAISTWPIFVANWWRMMQRRYLSSSVTRLCFLRQSVCDSFGISLLFAIFIFTTSLSKS